MLLVLPFWNDAIERTYLEKNNPWINNFQTERAAFFDTLPATDPNKPKLDIQYPQPSPQVEKMMNDYFDITDPKQKIKFLSDNPGISDQFAKASQYKQAIRAAQGLGPLDQYPVADQTTQSILNEYDALPQHDGPKGGNKTRAVWSQNNPEKNRIRQTYLTQASLYSLEKAAQQAGFQGQGFDSKALGQIKNLGQYDINMAVDANGNKIYRLAPGAGSGGGFGSGGGSKAKYAALINNNPADILKIDMMRAFGKNPTKYRVKIGKSAPNIRPVQFAKSHRSPGRIIHLNKLA